jgi:hypothetical protein
MEFSLVLGQLKRPMTSSELESMTLRLVAQCLNKLRYKSIMTIEDSNMEAGRTGNCGNSTRESDEEIK